MTIHVVGQCVFVNVKEMTKHLRTSLSFPINSNIEFMFNTCLRTSFPQDSLHDICRMVHRFELFKEPEDNLPAFYFLNHILFFNYS